MLSGSNRLTDYKKGCRLPGSLFFALEFLNLLTD